MNCKPGDLAVIVNDELQECIGRLVQVVGLANPNDYGPFWDGEEWECNSCNYPIPALDSDSGEIYMEYGELLAFHDKNLRPIRDQDGEDEILRIAGKPKAKERA